MVQMEQHKHKGHKMNWVKTTRLVEYDQVQEDGSVYKNGCFKQLTSKNVDGIGLAKIFKEAAIMAQNDIDNRIRLDWTLNDNGDWVAKYEGFECSVSEWIHNNYAGTLRNMRMFYVRHFSSESCEHLKTIIELQLKQLINDNIDN